MDFCADDAMFDKWVGHNPVLEYTRFFTMRNQRPTPGGERTDVGAHLTGFACGLVIGTLLALKPRWLSRMKSVQWGTGFLAVLLMVAAWTTALRI